MRLCARALYLIDTFLEKIFFYIFNANYILYKYILYNINLKKLFLFYVSSLIILLLYLLLIYIFP